MKIRILIVLFGLFACLARAQTIATAEYFFNEDPGIGKGTALTVPTNTGSYTIPTTNLADGFHSFYIRTSTSDGDWSLYDRVPFLIKTLINTPQTITAAEYFFNEDPGIGKGTALTVPTNTGEVSQSYSIPTTNLAEGFPNKN